MPDESRKTYEKPDLNPLGKEDNELSEQDLGKVSGGIVPLEPGNCATGWGDQSCAVGNSAYGKCEAGEGVTS